jgi:hypothetical protein
MLKAVAKIEKAWTNSALRCPVAWGVLECGHSAKLVQASDFNYSRAHDETQYLTKVGDSVQCERCDRYADTLAKIRALKRGDVQHSRFRPNDSRGSRDGNLYLYGRDPKSPSGVILLFSIEATKEAEDAIRAVTGTSSLSPTEGL